MAARLHLDVVIDHAPASSRTMPNRPCRLRGLMPGQSRSPTRRARVRADWEEPCPCGWRSPGARGVPLRAFSSFPACTTFNHSGSGGSTPSASTWKDPRPARSPPPQAYAVRLQTGAQLLGGHTDPIEFLLEVDALCGLGVSSTSALPVPQTGW